MKFNFQKKILPVEKLCLKAEELKKSKAKIIHCHGTFDLLHPGHLRHFQEAKLLGDILIVTITPDRFVIKGEGRPVYKEDLRLEGIASLEYVDFVGINDSANAVDLLKSLKPDLYVKGPDYKDHSNDPTGMIGKEIEAVQSVGGDIYYSDGIVFSSSEIIDKHF